MFIDGEGIGQIFDHSHDKLLATIKKIWYNIAILALYRIFRPLERCRFTKRTCLFLWDRTKTNPREETVKTLFKQLRTYALESVLGPLFKLLEAMFELFVPLVVADIVDRGISSADGGAVVRGFGILIALGLIGIVCSITAQYFAAKASVGCATKLRHALYAHIEALSFSDLDRIGIPTLITRLTGDLNTVQSGLNLALRLLLRSPFVVFGAMIMAFTIDRRAALIFLAVIAILGAVVTVIMATSVPAYKKVQSELDALTGTTRENLSGARVIRAFRMESGEREKFASHSDTLYRRQLTAGRISALMNPLTFVILNVGIILLLRTSGIRVNAGVLTTGQTVALYNYMTQILVELVKSANLIISISKAVSCMKRVEEVLGTEPGMSFPSSAPAEIPDAPAVEFRGVSLRYGAGEESLTDMDFRIERGETVGVIGGTGSGKTSLIALIPRFYDATAGEVLVNGVDVRAYPADVLRGKIGYVLQRASLFHGTIRSNLSWGASDADEEGIDAALRDAQAKDVVASKEDGLDSAVEQGGRNFSGGQRQRLTIARALVRRPEILILDDSASALDFATDAALRKSLAALDYRPTTIIVSQRTSSIRHADKIVVLDDGRVAGIGRHEELLSSCPVYREIYESQYKKEA
ncbi:MAG: ABC transporter ATP-binding protein [Clostridia bacterium]|nr:ABC transporter ATP-binding protein [Clostridia bacterium]